MKALIEESEEYIAGVVDEDPDKFANDERANIRILRLNEAKLIILRPRVEEWILEVARNSGLDVKKYRLHENAVKLHRHLKPSRHEILNKFRTFVGNLTDRHELRTLLSFLQDC